MTGNTNSQTSTRNFLRHFLEMVVAMIAGMAVFGAAGSLILGLAGHDDLLDSPTLSAFLMASYMTAGMSLWMRYRGHSWRRTWEMAGSMYVPFFALVLPYLTGAIGADGLAAGGHLAMLPCMLGVMLLRRGEYSQGHRHHASSPVSRTTSHAVLS